MHLERPKETAQRLGISKVTLWRWARSQPGFPQPYQLGPTAIGFDVAEIEAWVQGRRRPDTQKPQAA